MMTERRNKMAVYLVNELTGEIVPLARCKYHVVCNDSEALFEAIEDVDFKIPKASKLVEHPESTVAVSFDLTPRTVRR